MSEKTYDAAIVACPDYSDENIDNALNEALEKVGGLDFVKPGTKIVIKANMVAPKKPDDAAVTHPAMISALCRLLIKKGAEVVVGDSPGGLFTPVYLSGIYRAAKLYDIEKTGAKLNLNTKVREASFEGKVVKNLSYTAFLDDADYIINFAKLKTHGMLLYTGAVKNMFGIIPGLTKPDYHYRYPRPEDFANMLVDLNLFKTPVLNLIDAVMGMEGNGPSNGTPRYVGALIASKSAYAADIVGCEVIGLEASRVLYLKAANDRGLSTLSAKEFDIYGNISDFTVPDFKKMEDGSTHFKSRFVSTAFERKPVLVPDLCRECGKCAEMCPKNAIKLSPKPKIDRRSCIKCFCCQEFCPFSALIAKRPLIARILNR